MELLLELAMLAAVFYFIAAPLRKSHLLEEETVVENELSDLLYRRDTLYTSLHDLEFDHATGKVDQADYEVMKAQFKGEAVKVLKAIDDVKPGQ